MVKDNDYSFYSIQRTEYTILHRQKDFVIT